jgi:hypothetical protein
MLFHFNMKKSLYLCPKGGAYGTDQVRRKRTELSAESFVPWGSLAFFGLLIGLAILVWLSIYFLMLNRG